MNPDPTSFDWSEIAAYLGGGLSDADRHRFEQQLAADADLRAAVAETRHGLDELDAEAASTNTESLDRSRQRLLDTIASAATTSAPMTSATLLDGRQHDESRLRFLRSHVKSHSGASAFRWALVPVALVVTTVAIITARVHHADPSAAPSSESRVYSTRAGEKATVHLAEGTQITLAPATTVHVHGDSVTIRGAAYFQVTPRTHRVLIVRTSNAVVQVLGTRFTVRQYATDLGSNVLVEEGKVSLRSVSSRTTDATPVVLTARMMGQVTDSTVRVTSGIAVADYAGWVHGRLVFRKTPLHEVVEELARAYGADIDVADSTLAKASVTFAVAVDREPLPRVLDELGFVSGAHVIQNQHAFVLVPGQRATQPLQPGSQQKRFPQPERIYGR